MLTMCALEFFRMLCVCRGVSRGKFKLGGSRLAASLKLRVVGVLGVFGAELAYTKACTQEGGNTGAKVAGVLLPGAPT